MRKNLILSLFLLVAISIGGFLIWRGINWNKQSLPPSQINSNILGQQSVATPSPSNPGTSQTSAPASSEKYLVTKVVDGDTFQINYNGQKVSVRMVGIDTPETVDPRRPVGCFGKNASNETKRLIEGKEVVLIKDISDTDKYNRLLRYVYLPLSGGQNLFINDYLVRQGFAKAYTYPPDVKYNERFLEAEKEARENLRGLWNECK